MSKNKLDRALQAIKNRYGFSDSQAEEALAKILEYSIDALGNGGKLARITQQENGTPKYEVYNIFNGEFSNLDVDPNKLLIREEIITVEPEVSITKEPEGRVLEFKKK